MSERGSFVTEYVYCDECFEAAKKVLLGKHKYLCSQVIETYDPLLLKNLNIIAGKIGGSYPSEEIDTFEFEFIPELEKTICHPLRIAVLAEVGEKIFFVEPIILKS